MKKIVGAALAAVVTAGLCGCENKVEYIPADTLEQTINEIMAEKQPQDAELLRRGVSQAAALWREEDGSAEEFKAFALQHFAASEQERKTLFDKLSEALEVFSGSYDIMSVQLGRRVTLDTGELDDVDYILGSYSPSAHYTSDMFENKIAFITVLNFPNYTLEEKLAKGEGWSRLEWAYARMGDVFTDRIPSDISRREAEVYSAAENYIASYNIMMGHLLTEDGRRLFPEDMCLLSHWNLRDEIKSDYASGEDALLKQEMVYKVMERISSQEIPQIVINNPEYDWMPFSNRVFRGSEEIAAEREPDTRYQKILDIFNLYLEQDKYCPASPTAIRRNFDGSFEMSDKEIESLFTGMLSAPQFGAIASVVKERLGRDLRPFDIWYDGFKKRSSIKEDDLSEMTRKRYPDAAAFEKDMPRLLGEIGFSKQESDFIASRIVVEAARGSGHAWPCLCRWHPARLRTRVPASGMDYKGYNIACHEFGHNVEMILDLYNIDYYTLFGVPNTAFTEALAFLFQQRDLQFLGLGRQPMDNSAVLDCVWGMYEIMGVSLVDMYMWRWLYENAERKVTAGELRQKTLEIARDVWNKYFEPVMGTHDSSILAIYSHMVNAPMYLPNYPLGDLIHFQIERSLAPYEDSPAEFASEISRIYKLGRLTPQEWMRQAFGTQISIQPALDAVDKALL